jgi:hypothetical protein
MDRKHYLHCLRTNQFDAHVFYDYYKEHNKREEYNLDLMEFHNLFNQYVSTFGINSAINTVKQYYDVKFEIVEVLDKEGKVIDRY